MWRAAVQLGAKYFLLQTSMEAIWRLLSLSLERLGFALFSHRHNRQTCSYCRD
jgi:hypothetical protein